MTTVDDDATMREEHFRDLALKYRKPDGPKSTGHCLWCNEELEHGRRWCDAECREDWELDQKCR